MNFKSELKRLISLHNWNEALHLAEALDLTDTSDWELLYLCGKIYENSHRILQSSDLFSKAFHLEPNNYEIIVAFANVSIKTNNIENARKSVDKLMEIMPDEYETLRLSYELSKLLNEDTNKLIDMLEEMKKIEYNDNYAYELARTYWVAGNNDKCISECRRLINYFRGGDTVVRAKELINDVIDGKKINDGKDSLIEITPIKKNNTENKPSTDKINSSKITGFKNFFSNKGDKKEQKNPVKPILLPPEIEKEFEGLIGMESVKGQMLKFINMIKLNEKRGLSSSTVKDSSEGYHFMLLGNPGTGKTTVARIIAKVLNLLSIRTSEVFIEVDKSGLVGKYIGHTEENVKSIIAQAQGGSLFIDEAYTLYDKDNPKDFGREALNVLMKSMEDHRDSFSVILAGYKKQMFEMLEANVGLKSRINYIIEIPDYSDEELLQIADKIAEEKALIITDSGKKAIKERINRERVDDKFGNARFIRSLINEAYSNLANRLVSSKHSYEDMFKLEAIDFGINLEKTPEEEIEQALKELKELVGLDGVKSEVESIVNTMKVMREMANRGLNTGNLGFGTLHMAFLGGPGTGKTTVARIIGRIYKALGVLKRGDIFIECSRKDLVGEYQGHTGPKTQGKINEAMGGILFIDEAYDLYGGENDSFGKEAITTLIAEMENNRDKLMVILAGYKDDINGLLDANPGFRSRINTEIYFEDYKVDQLVDIFINMANKESLHLDNGVIAKVKDLVSEKSSEKDFGNARGVRNILQNILRNKNNRVAKEMTSGKNLKEEDFLTIKQSDIF